MSLADHPCVEYVGESHINDDQWCNRCGWSKVDHAPAPPVTVPEPEGGDEE